MPKTDDTPQSDETTRADAPRTDDRPRADDAHRSDDGPRADAPERSRGDILARVLSYMVAITTILGIPIGLYGYYASQQANRVNRTFDFYKDFRGDGLQKDFSLLVVQWNEKSAQVEGFLKNDDYAGLSQLTASLLQNDEAQSALSRIVLFFDEAYSCVDKALCDYDAAYALLQSPADQIFSMYGSYLQTVRQQQSNYADGIVKVRALTRSWSLL
jgi:hypothetical protein